jgi:hypothetical protein
MSGDLLSDGPRLPEARFPDAERRSLSYRHTGSRFDGFLASGALRVAKRRDGARPRGRTDLLGPPRADTSVRQGTGLHDGHGPRTEPPWREGEVPGATVDGDRPRLVARPHTTR